MGILIIIYASFGLLGALASLLGRRLFEALLGEVASQDPNARLELRPRRFRPIHDAHNLIGLVTSAGTLLGGIWTMRYQRRGVPGSRHDRGRFVLRPHFVMPELVPAGISATVARVGYVRVRFRLLWLDGGHPALVSQQQLPGRLLTLPQQGPVSSTPMRRRRQARHGHACDRYTPPRTSKN